MRPAVLHSLLLFVSLLLGAPTIVPVNADSLAPALRGIPPRMSPGSRSDSLQNDATAYHLPGKGTRPDGLPPPGVPQLMVTAWCERCEAIEEFLAANKIFYRRAYIKKSSPEWLQLGNLPARGGTNVLRIPVASTGIELIDFKRDPICHLIGSLIQAESASGGCIMHRNSNLSKVY
jgi:hypothetical protein